MSSMLTHYTVELILRFYHKALLMVSIDLFTAEQFHSQLI
ncbi:Hypothetical protein ETEE_1038 [Edwardsiella anguillarum ET080813]|uniref:Uncharacterized protein n=1 Tax=Edwardsiella anguillarum ET080813 TaxID=667120 RepID=A0A076LLB4_9GAMM|nr:Hypothetical protein ETEE_1038 [Edwardsiella anguillarum ET080813]